MVHNHATNYRLDLSIDAVIVGFIEYKIKDELLQKIYISHMSIDAYYQRNGLGTYLLNCLKKEFSIIALLSFRKSLNIFYEKNNFVEDLSERKLKNMTHYMWTK